MQWQSSPYVLFLLLGAVTTFAWALYGVRSARRGRRTPTVLAFVALSLSVSIWSALYAVQLAAPTLEAKLIAYKLLHVGGVVAPPAWLAFAVSYSGRSDLLTPAAIGGLAAIPAALLLTLPTNPYSLALTHASLETHGSLTVLVTVNGPIYLLHLAFSYVVIIVGAWLVLSQAVRSGPRVRRQAALVAVGALLPLAVNVFHVLSIPPLDGSVGVNLTPLSLSVSAVLFGVAVFRYQLLDLSPIASKVVLSQMSDGVVVTDDGGTVLDVNPAAEALLGDRERVLGTDVSTHLPGDDRVVGDGGVLTITTGTGDERAIQPTRSPLTSGGVRYGWVVLLHDVTTIESQRRELERQNERLDAFTKAVSHDLRNPLAVIDGYADLASETGDPDHFEVIRDTVARTTDFLEDLLQLSQRGETVTSPRPVSLSAVVAEVAGAVADDDLTVEVDGDGVDGDLVVLADERRLRQVLDNLLRNARDHADGAVSVTVGPLPDGFFLEDDGPGIPRGKRAEVFEIGFTTRQEGTGFGLAIVRDLVEAHGWSIDVVEGASGGARFEVTGVDRPDDA
ncbi:PAS domain-containing protein [Halorubrum sp. JWXQ-INN 858]|uniref:histidine kinase N-terminal 7TM domain-containing protein n=1 Tax=Halorubrum sp. JWXQ-INN 858 TaxID=2690782 RepID=UPI001359B924|nr:histidine kinase N-terminal 7TM domain-containing protein [Halorubrum sp. JWXQ-INN 858]MWV65823.1 PAS domain-containing protein [Halorubrum sp. JWXQ-INN 858]